MPKNGSQITIADRLAAIEFMISHLYWTLYQRVEATPETIAQPQRQLREQFQTALRADVSRSVPTAEGLEALDRLLAMIAEMAGPAGETKG